MSLGEWFPTFRRVQRFNSWDCVLSQVTAARFFETSATAASKVQRHIAEGSNPEQHRREQTTSFSFQILVYTLPDPTSLRLFLEGKAARA
jgi:hypothetical protein